LDTENANWILIAFSLARNFQLIMRALFKYLRRACRKPPEKSGIPFPHSRRCYNDKRGGEYLASVDKFVNFRVFSRFLSENAVCRGRIHESQP